MGAIDNPSLRTSLAHMTFWKLCPHALNPPIDNQPRHILPHKRTRLHRRNKPLNPTGIPKPITQLDILKRVPRVLIWIAVPHLSVQPRDVTITDLTIPSLDSNEAGQEVIGRRRWRKDLVSVFDGAGVRVHEVLE